MPRRDLSKPLAESRFGENTPKKKSNPVAYATGTSQTRARQNLNKKLRAAGYASGANDPRAPKYKLYHDKEKGVYNYRK